MNAHDWLVDLRIKLGYHFDCLIMDRPDYWRTRQLELVCPCVRTEMEKQNGRFRPECVCSCHGEHPFRYVLLFDAGLEHPDDDDPEFQVFLERCQNHRLHVQLAEII